MCIIHSNVYALSAYEKTGTFPHIVGPVLGNQNLIFDSKRQIGKVWVVVMWASWEKPTEEWNHHWETLVKASHEYPGIFYGINYRDNKRSATDFLERHGNPFEESIVDKNGQLGIELNVFQIPEILVISKKGEIIYRITSLLNENDWENQLKPVIKKSITGK